VLTVGLIPARGGSKGIPRKNIKPLAGKPLIAWTIEAALRSQRLDRVVVSTEDEEIADVARRHGADVPFMRPAALAQDATPGVEPALHALSQIPECDALVLLQCTSPLRTSADVDESIALAERLDAPSVVSVTAPRDHPYWMFNLRERGRLEPLMDVPEVASRQDLPPVYAMNGAIYFARAAWLRSTKTFVTRESVGYVMPADRSVDLDTPVDWTLAELMLGAPR
jgi:CMP-N,N'-diacetyllegionaminic acid synthase